MATNIILFREPSVKIAVFYFREDFANSSYSIFTNAPIGIPPRGYDHLIYDVLKDLNNIFIHNRDKTLRIRLLIVLN